MKNTIEKIESNIEGSFLMFKTMNEDKQEYTEKEMKMMRYWIDQCLAKMKDELNKL